MVRDEPKEEVKEYVPPAVDSGDDDDDDDGAQFQKLPTYMEENFFEKAKGVENHKPE